MIANPDAVEQDLAKLLRMAHLLRDLLTQEQGALNSDPSALTTIAEYKARDAQKLNDGVDAFVGLVKTNRSGEKHDPADLPGTEDMRGAFSAIGRPGLAEGWQELQRLLQEIAEQNRVNGHRVQLMTGHVDRALAILKGSGGEQTERTYGSDGHFREIAQSHRHTRA